MQQPRQTTPSGAMRRALYVPPAAGAVLTGEPLDTPQPAAEPTYSGPMPDEVADELHSLSEAEAINRGPNPLVWGALTAGALGIGAAAVVLGVAVLVLADPFPAEMARIAVLP